MIKINSFREIHVLENFINSEESINNTFLIDERKESKLKTLVFGIKKTI